MKTVLVIFGGVSSEHDVSLISACSVIKNIPSDKYEVKMLGITKEGRWLLYSGNVENLPNDKWIDSRYCRSAVISPDISHRGVLVAGEEGTEIIPIDIVFPVLHGKNGEDGTIQGLLQLAQIPFVGCDMLSSAMGMDKSVTNAIADISNVAQAKWLSTGKYEYFENPDKFKEKCLEYIGFPMFIKPANAGSSVGISKVKSEKDFEKAMENAFLNDNKVVVEEGINGIEVECSVLGNESLFAPVVGEIVPCNEFYDYDAKYIADDSELHIPARVSEEAFKEVQETAKKIYRALGCSGLARVDFFVDKASQKVLFNEINTIPGFTAISMYPKMIEAGGMSYPELVDRLLTLAVEKKGSEPIL